MWPEQWQEWPVQRVYFYQQGRLPRELQTAQGEGFPALHSFWIRLFVNNQAQYKWGSHTLPGNISEETARLNRDLIFRIEATHLSAYTALLFIFENVRRELWEKHMERDQKHRQCICEMSNLLLEGSYRLL